MIADSWKDVKQGTVANCWKHVGILQFGEDQYDTTDLNPEDIRPLLSNIEAMTHRLEVDPSKRWQQRTMSTLTSDNRTSKWGA
jgi:hypothetical protein